MNSLQQSIYNPLAKDRVTFLKRAADTGGEYTLVKVELAPKGGNSLHYHTTFIEEFEVLEGTLSIDLEKKVLRLMSGEKTVAPKYKLHRFFNESPDRPCTFLVTIRPARKFEEMLRTAYGLINDGLTNDKGIPKNFWHTVLLFNMGETYLPGIPLRLQMWLSGGLASIAHRLGRHRDLEKYYQPLPVDQQIAA